MNAMYDDRGFIYRGRVVSPDPGKAPDAVWSCPTCAALVMDPDRLTHELWHGDDNV